MNGNYPLGAEYLPNAPFNQPEPIEKDYDVEVTATLNCYVTITGRGTCRNEEGDICTDDISLANDFYDQKHSPKSLIRHLYNILREHQEIQLKARQNVLDCCGMWLGGCEDIEVEEA